MSFSVTDYANEAPPSSTIGSINPFLSEVNLPGPIDTYVIQSRSLRSYGTAVRLSENPHLGGLLLLGVISAAEAYFRSVISLTLVLCPICRDAAAAKSINLGGVLWHGHAEFRRSAFDDTTFCSKDGVTKAATGYLKFKMKDSEFAGPLEEFDIACQLRHGIVHNGGILPGKNAVKIGANSFKKPVRIAVDFALLERTIEAVDTLVLTFNRELFGEMCERWAIDWRSRSDWVPTKEDETFRKLWKTFFCSELHKSRIGKTNISRKKCLIEVRDKYNL